MDLRGRHFLTLKDFDQNEIKGLLDLAREMKHMQKSRQLNSPMQGQVMAMIFQKPSLRTRVSFETGMYQLGGNSIYLGPSEIGMGQRESVGDIGRVLSRQVDIIMARVFGHNIVEELAESSSVPVINGLSDYTHPCQAIADFQTIQERGKRFEGLKLAYVGDGNNVANSLIFGGLTLGMNIVTASPQSYQVASEVQAWASETAGSLTVTTDVEEAARNADVLYTDVWASMGQEAEKAERKKAFEGYQINQKLLSLAQHDALVLHCLPAHYGEEITEEVAMSAQSAIFDQAENRLHAQKALIVSLSGV